MRRETASPLRLTAQGLSHAREVARRGQIWDMYLSLPVLLEKLEEKKGEAAVVKKEKKKSRSQERYYRELWRKDPEAYAARMAQLIRDIDDLETGKAGRPPPKEGQRAAEMRAKPGAGEDGRVC
ncbi:MAG: hypothetical protein QXR19_16975 [Candidatus Jordarchaeaceae archaeon]